MNCLKNTSLKQNKLLRKKKNNNKRFIKRSTIIIIVENDIQLEISIYNTGISNYLIKLSILNAIIY